MIYVISFRDPQRENVLNVTSSSKDWGKAFSPFFLGPVSLYQNMRAENVENAWQYSKVYPQHIGPDGNPTQEYFDWARAGWADKWAHRYPMGKGAVPKYSLWKDQRLSYIEARKQIYIPLYTQAVVRVPEFQRLKDWARTEDVYLRDYDGYNHKALDMSMDDVIHCEERKMGHAFVLAALLEAE